MVITKLIGGLGNQLFQYAAGYSLARRLGTKLLVDISDFQNYSLHKVAITHFEITAQILPIEKSGAIKPKLKLGNGVVRLPWAIYEYEENGLHYNEQFEKLRGNIFLNGYWQTDKYFSRIADFIRTEFRLKSPLSEQDRSLLNQIQNCNSLSIHIRRGDYVSNSHTQSVHGVCSDTYYLKAIEKMRALKNVDTLFVFSDEPDWVKKNMKFDIETKIVSHNSAERNFADLYLMSQSKHIITANSTFSWWAAWLNPNQEKLIIMPDPWFSENSMNTGDRYFSGVLPLGAN